MRVIRDLIATFFSGLFLFMAMICGGVCAFILFLFYLASGLLLFVSVSAGVVYLFDHKPHMLAMAVAYFGYSAVAFAIPVALARVPHLIGGSVERRRQEKLSLERMAALRIASDASFHDGGRWPQSHASK